MNVDLATDDTLAAELADAAGQLLLELRAGPLEGKALGDEGDRRSNDYLLERLAAARPEDAVLSEESADSSERLSASRVWIIDPLDGTREYTEPGRTDWAVHVALWSGGDLVAGSVALPAQGVTLSSNVPSLRAARPAGPPRLVVSRSRPPAMTEGVAAVLGAELVAMGSAGAKAMSVVQGQTDVYLHAGGQWEWDSAAPIAVCRAAGLHTSRIDGSPLVYNQPHPWLPDLLICRPELADQVLEAVADIEAEDHAQ